VCIWLWSWKIPKTQFRCLSLKFVWQLGIVLTNVEWSWKPTSIKFARHEEYTSFKRLFKWILLCISLMTAVGYLAKISSWVWIHCVIYGLKISSSSSLVLYSLGGAPVHPLPLYGSHERQLQWKENRQAHLKLITLAWLLV